MKKRIVSLAMAACLVLSMMVTLSACGGKPTLEEYYNSEYRRVRYTDGDAAGRPVWSRNSTRTNPT